ncbi:hypothetical protein T09_2717 [Trichinella sp. T9]|nr:hypothetical protein T09_2717 [Trichinella sp. T9]
MDSVEIHHLKNSLERRILGEVVRSVRNALRKVLGRSLLRFDELRTTLCKLESRINNRPLTLLSEDPEDCAPHTPAHFLIGRELAALPTISGETPSGMGARHLGRRWRHQQLLMRYLWKRWTDVYLVSLNVRGKWEKIDRPPEVDDLVLVTEDTVPRNRWKLGGVTALFGPSDCEPHGSVPSRTTESVAGASRASESMVMDYVHPGGDC